MSKKNLVLCLVWVLCLTVCTVAAATIPTVQEQVEQRMVPYCTGVKG